MTAPLSFFPLLLHLDLPLKNFFNILLFGIPLLMQKYHHDKLFKKAFRNFEKNIHVSNNIKDTLELTPSKMNICKLKYKWNKKGKEESKNTCLVSSKFLKGMCCKMYFSLKLNNVFVQSEQRFFFKHSNISYQILIFLYWKFNMVYYFYTIATISSNRRFLMMY